MGNTKAKWLNGLLYFWDSVTHERVLPVAPVYFRDDFLGAAVDTHKWTKLTVGAGPPTQLIITSQNGAVQLLMTNADEVQYSGLYFGDILPFMLDHRPIFEARVRFTTLLTGTSTAVFGLCSATNASIDNVTDSVWFRFDGATGGLAQAESDDTAAGHEKSKVTTGSTFLVNEWHILRIDLSTATDAKFYIDGVRVCSTTTFDVSTDADQEYQPMIRLDKAHEAADLGVAEVDYVRVWSSR